MHSLTEFTKTKNKTKRHPRLDGCAFNVHDTWLVKESSPWPMFLEPRLSSCVRSTGRRTPKYFYNRINFMSFFPLAIVALGLFISWSSFFNLLKRLRRYKTNFKMAISGDIFFLKWTKPLRIALLYKVVLTFDPGHEVLRGGWLGAEEPSAFHGLAVMK